MRNNKTAPSYCKDAIATSRGWVHPKTGELLVSQKNLDLGKPQVDPSVVSPIEAFKNLDITESQELPQSAVDTFNELADEDLKLGLTASAPKRKYKKRASKIVDSND